MTRKSILLILTSFVLAAGLLAAGGAAPARGGEKTLDTYVGQLVFQDQTITQATAKKLHRRMDLQRASQLVLWSLPAVSLYQLHQMFLHELKADPRQPVIGLFEGYDAVYPFLTANATTPYTVSVLDLKQTGPVVVEIPAGEVYGVANDAWQQPIKEIGSGRAERLLFLGPGQKAPQDFKGEVIPSPTYMMMYFYRVLGTGPEAKALKTAVKAYRLDQAARPPQTKYVKYQPRAGAEVVLNTPPAGMAYWKLVNDYVQQEPLAGRDRFFYAWLTTLGIAKGQPFQPSAYQKEVLQEGLTVGMAMAQATAFNKRFPSARYMGDSGWEDVMAGMDPRIDLPDRSMFDERASYTFEAVTTSQGMTKREEGKGSAYLGTYYDSQGNALMGGHTYRLHLEPDPPAANFWSVTVYDIANRLLIRNKIRRSDLSSRMRGLKKNADGSVDLYFGPQAPPGEESNWVQTNPGESFFIYLRLYGPLKPFIEQKWPMNRVERIK
ncbi:MAG: DUF1254 domain-containing protein [Desulfarculaceae bacterium]|nr:DUF1254 domain-containing protein [Desulfarculaceae bacterium]MCF8070757.1 DUF1254 domain-containing protein [Desulfarculaceae bacterium]MCF8102194.1 DUF1254 domain-containing protein [Desulfarculaceae bacterium]MCF8117007.1 DUF1254 domain-containing protein [Desulfarculaceae bacterium]